MCPLHQTNLYNRQASYHYVPQGATMSTLTSMALVFGAVLVLLSMDYSFAEVDKQTAESAKKATESEKKTVIMSSPTSVKSKGTAVKIDPLKKRVDNFFNRIDTDKDGKISHDEFMMPDENFFKTSDSNNDGVLTKEELQNAWKKRMTTKSKYRMMREQLKIKEKGSSK
jgi:Ca2+-binding EF-hand superfamily protein